MEGLYTPPQLRPLQYFRIRDAVLIPFSTALRTFVVLLFHPYTHAYFAITESLKKKLRVRVRSETKDPANVDSVISMLVSFVFRPFGVAKQGACCIYVRIGTEVLYTRIENVYALGVFFPILFSSLVFSVALSPLSRIPRTSSFRPPCARCIFTHALLHIVCTFAPRRIRVFPSALWLRSAVPRCNIITLSCMHSSMGVCATYTYVWIAVNYSYITCIRMYVRQQ